MKIKFMLIVLNLVIMSGCTMLTKKLAPSFAGTLMALSSPELEKQTNWEFMKNALPGNLILAQSLWSLSEDNQDLLYTLTLGHQVYAFGVWETLYWKKKWALGNEKSEWEKNQTLYHYNQAIKFGEKYMLETNGPKDNQQSKEVAFALGMAYALSINLQKDNPQQLSLITKAYNYVDFTCKKDPKFKDGLCSLFYGLYELTRPSMMGGDHELGKKILTQAMQEYPHQPLILTSYLQFYTIPRIDHEEFILYKNRLDQYGENNSNSNYFQALGMERWLILKENESQFF